MRVCVCAPGPGSSGAAVCDAYTRDNMRDFCTEAMRTVQVLSVPELRNAYLPALMNSMMGMTPASMLAVLDRGARDAKGHLSGLSFVHAALVLFQNTPTDVAHTFLHARADASVGSLLARRGGHSSPVVDCCWLPHDTAHVPPSPTRCTCAPNGPACMHGPLAWNTLGLRLSCPPPIAPLQWRSCRLSSITR